MKELNIESPEGYEIDKEKSTFEKIVFKKISEKYPTKLEQIERRYYLAGGNIEYCKYPIGTHNVCFASNKEYFSSRGRAEEVQALIQLIAFRDAVWVIDNWKPDWFDQFQKKYIIYTNANEVRATIANQTGSILVFKTAETRDWFLNTHKNLIEIAKNLL